MHATNLFWVSVAFLLAVLPAVAQQPKVLKVRVRKVPARNTSDVVTSLTVTFSDTAAAQTDHNPPFEFALNSHEIALIQINRKKGPTFYFGNKMRRRLWQRADRPWQFNEASLGDYAEQLAKDQEKKNALMNTLRKAIWGNAAADQKVDQMVNAVWGNAPPRTSGDKNTSGDEKTDDAEKILLVLQCLYADRNVRDIAEAPSPETIKEYKKTVEAEKVQQNRDK